jgi:hypothetical protein
MPADSPAPATVATPAKPDPETDPNGYGSIGDAGILDAIEIDLALEDTVVEPKPAPAAKAAPAKSDAVSPKPPPPEPKHPDWMVEQAKDLGIDDEIVEGSSTAALGKLITREMKKERAELARDKKADSAAPPVPSDPVAAFWAEQGEVDDEGKTVKVKDVQFHPALKKVLDTIVREVHGLKGTVGQSAQTEEQAKRAQLIAALDAEMAKFPGVFGAGAIDAVSKAAPKLAARRRDIMGKLLSRDFPAGTTARAAVIEVAGELFDLDDDPPPAPRKSGRNHYVEDTVARPTQRGAGAQKKKGPAAAAEAMEKYLEDNNLDLDSDPAEDPHPESEY